MIKGTGINRSQTPEDTHWGSTTEERSDLTMETESSKRMRKKLMYKHVAALLVQENGTTASNNLQCLSLTLVILIF